MMEYKQIKRKKIYEQVAEALHEKIRSGELKPADKLDSVEMLAENFKVGRSAVREALSALKALGIIEIRQGEGTYVKQFEPNDLRFPLSIAMLMNSKDIMNLLEVRKIIEIGAAETAARKRNADDLIMMEKALEEMKIEHGNAELGERSDLNFHLAVASSTQNTILVNLLTNISALMGETMKETRRIWFSSRETTRENLYEEHLAVYRAILARDVEGAKQAMGSHLENVEKVIRKYFHESKKKMK